MSEVILYSESNESKSVIPKTKEWHDLLAQGWTSWKKPEKTFKSKKKS